MIVVEGARSKIGRDVILSVTSSLQTSAGKMIFGRFESFSSQDGSGDSPSGDGGRRPNFRRAANSSPSPAGPNSNSSPTPTTQPS
jgi:hypothetical protein